MQCCIGHAHLRTSGSGAERRQWRHRWRHRHADIAGGRVRRDVILRATAQHTASGRLATTKKKEEEKFAQQHERITSFFYRLPRGFRCVCSAAIRQRQRYWSCRVYRGKPCSERPVRHDSTRACHCKQFSNGMIPFLCCCCCCCYELVRHCLYGGQRGPEEMRNSTRLWIWRDPSLPRDSWQPFYWLRHHSRAAVVAHSWRIVDHCQTIDVDRCRQNVKLLSVLRLCSGFYRSKDPTNSIKVLIRGNDISQTCYRSRDKNVLFRAQCTVTALARGSVQEVKR